jgi:hypothetical protein
MKFLNSLFRSLLIAAFSRLIIVFWNDDLSSRGPLVLSGVAGLLYFFWYLRRPRDYHPTSFFGKLFEGVFRIAMTAVVVVVVMLSSQADASITSGVLGAIGFLGVFLYLPWFVIFRETDSEKAERMARKENKKR